MGGNFLGHPDEGIPVCQETGRTMRPLLQVLTSDLPAELNPFPESALVNIRINEDIWADPLADLWEGQCPAVFCVREYAGTEGLVPVGPGYRELRASRAKHIGFPVRFEKVAAEKPSWEDFATQVPRRVAQSFESDWFFEDGTPDLPPFIVKFGGWPQWIQGSEWPGKAEFLFQIDYSDELSLGFGDGGSVYFFRSEDGSLRFSGDCF